MLCLLERGIKINASKLALCMLCLLPGNQKGESTTVAGGTSLSQMRIKVKLVLGEYQRKTLDWGNGSPTSATLVKRGTDWYLHIQVKVNALVDNPQLTSYLGVELGRKDIAVTSNGISFSCSHQPDKKFWLNTGSTHLCTWSNLRHLPFDLTQARTMNIPLTHHIQ